MADYRNIIIDVEGLEAGKFYKMYTDSNATALLISKDVDDKLELEVEQLKADVNTLINQNSGQVITISNSGGSAPATSKKVVKVRGNMSIKLSELSAHAVIVHYCLYKGSDIEAGTLTIIDGEDTLLEADRTHPTALLPVTFTANRDNDTLNLNLAINSHEIYTFEYSTIIF